MLNTGVSLQRLATKAGVGFTPKKLFSNGEAGVWYDPSDVEASLTWRRNLLEYTESFDNDYYTGYFQKPNFTTGQADPLGGYNAMKWNASTTTGGDGTKGGFYRGDSGGVIKPNTDYTVSVWLKATAPIVVSIGLMDGGSQNVSVTTSWQRFSLTIQKSTNPVHQARMLQIVESSNADVDIYIFGAQTEEGSTATEYQPIRTTFDNEFKQAFPKHTLYQNEEGKNPVTGMGQAVGLMLDKSKGLQFGDELVVNGTYDSNINGWTVPTGSASTISYSNGALAATRGNEAIAVSTLSTPVVAGKGYRLEFDIVSKSDTSGWVYVKLNNFITDQNSTYGKSTGKKIYTFTATQNASIIEIFAGGVASFSFVIDNVSLVELSGSHATQLDSTKRPVFARHPERGRVNLFKYTEEFDNGVWTKTGATSVTPNAGVAPNGTQTADRVDNFDDAQGDRLKQTITITNSTLRGSVWVKGEGSNIGKDITLVIKRLGGTYTGSSITHTLTDSWVRLDGNVTQLSDNTGASLVFSSPASNSAESFLVWGAQMELANEATGYQKVVDDYDITESGYKSVYYLQFDGVNDCMKIPSLTSSVKPLTALLGYSATNMDATAHRFLLDIATGRTVLGTDSNGTFGYHDGTWRTVSTVDENAIKVLTYDLVVNNAKMRENGIQFYSDTTYDEDAVSGDIGLFSRYSLDNHHVAGNLYQFVLRAEESTDKEIDQAEEFVAIKTGLKSEVVGQATLDLNFGANTYTARNSNGSVL